jgi:hypothetical protein
MEMEDIRWRQRSKRHGYKDGDQNTKFFHAWANQRRKFNSIKKINDVEGNGWTSQEGIGRAFSSYFQSLFSSAGSEGLQELLEVVQPRVLYFLNLGLFDPSLNFTYIALILKLSQSIDVTNYRSISLCNVLYKIIAKVLANKLKRVLPGIISPQQSAFVLGRLISDNVIVAYEVLHTMHTRIRGKMGFMEIKLDMSKAYNRVEWGFLEAIMRRLRFVELWIELIMKCVSLVSYSMLVNGIPQDSFRPTRGIRQGDPLSPYLFLLCAEGLRSLL